MVLRKIVKIVEEKCDGCGLCASACAEGAIKIVNGKAKLVSESYCDGLGACIGHCPQDAITVEQREAAPFDEEATKMHLAGQKNVPVQTAFVCPGLAPQELRAKRGSTEPTTAGVASELTHWPVQLKLVAPNATYFVNADLLLVADCVPFAMGDFHSRILKDHSVVVGCPKLDDTGFYVEKLSAILKASKLNSLTVVHMEVPCCFGLKAIAEQALTAAGKRDIPLRTITVGLDGRAKE